MHLFPRAAVADDMRPQPPLIPLGQFGRPLRIAVKPCDAPAVGTTESAPGATGDECRDLARGGGRQAGGVDGRGAVRRGPHDFANAGHGDGTEADGEPDELVRQRVRGGERILFRTRNSNGHWQTGPFIEDFVYVSAEAAEYLAKLGVLMVGIDYLSGGGYLADGDDAHRFLLEAGVWVVEGLDLSGVVQGHYEMICLPLRIAGGDGAPARVLLKPVDLSSKPEG